MQRNETDSCAVVTALEEVNTTVPGFQRDGRIGDTFRWDKVVKAVPKSVKGRIEKPSSLRVRWVADRAMMRRLVKVHNARFEGKDEKDIKDLEGEDSGEHVADSMSS